jgi:hypothetical protein
MTDSDDDNEREAAAVTRFYEARRQAAEAWGVPETGNWAAMAATVQVVFERQVMSRAAVGQTVDINGAGKIIELACKFTPTPPPPPARPIEPVKLEIIHVQRGLKTDGSPIGAATDAGSADAVPPETCASEPAPVAAEPFTEPPADKSAPAQPEKPSLKNADGSVDHVALDQLPDFPHADRGVWKNYVGNEQRESRMHDVLNPPQPPLIDRVSQAQAGKAGDALPAFGRRAQ